MPHDLERKLFEACLDLPPADRPAYLDRACASDPALRLRIEQLLAAHDLPTSQLGALPSVIPAEFPFDIGPYRILRVLGEGGMGTVYEAEQQHPVRRPVAVKVIRRGQSGGAAARGILSRFAAERQALALMDHPHVAKVFDAGESPSGELYFAMELVAGGVPLSQYCHQHRLSTRARVLLFVQLCRAVEHAHQKGIIHRDLKPANVLVSGSPHQPSIKVIDFGIAKAVSDAAAPASGAVTATGVPLGTPAYMSPEQARAGADIDTRSDVYSLGVILYELLSGQLPADPSADGYAPFLARLASGEVSIVPPGARPDRTAPDLDQSQDLDAITLRALEHERSRRYPSASALAEDLERYLAHLPVLARRPTLAYRVGKFIRRNRVQSAAAATALLALLGGSLAATVGYVRANRAEASAREEAATARESAAYLEEVFKVVDPNENLGRTVTARELLANASARIESGFGSRPAVRQRLLTSLSRAHASLGLFQEASALAGKAIANLPPEGQESLADADALLAAATTAHLLDRFEHAGQLAARSSAIRLRRLGPDHLDLADSLILEAQILAAVDRFNPAAQMAANALRIRERSLGLLHPQVGRTLKEMSAIVLRRRQPGDRQLALDHAERALSILEHSLGPDHHETAELLDLIANCQRDPAHEMPWLERALAIRRRVFGPEHLSVSKSYFEMGRLLSRRGKFADAKRYLLECLRIREAAFGKESALVGVTLRSLGTAEAGLNGYASAVPYYERALAVTMKALGPDHSHTRINQSNLGRILTSLGQYDRAIPLLREGMKGGSYFEWSDDWFDRVRQNPRYLALLAEQTELQARDSREPRVITQVADRK